MQYYSVSKENGPVFTASNSSVGDFLDYPKKSLLDSFDEDEYQSECDIEVDDDEEYQQYAPCKVRSFQMRLGSLYDDMGLAVENVVKSFGSSKCGEEAEKAIDRNSECCKRCPVGQKFDSRKATESIFSLHFRGSWDSSQFMNQFSQSTDVTQEESTGSWDSTTEQGTTFSHFMKRAKQDVEDYELESPTQDTDTITAVFSPRSFLGKEEDGSSTILPTVRDEDSFILLESVSEHPVVLGIAKDIGEGLLLRTRSTPGPITDNPTRKTATLRSRSFESADLAKIAAAMNRKKLQAATASIVDTPSVDNNCDATWRGNLMGSVALQKTLSDIVEEEESEYDDQETKENGFGRIEDQLTRVDSNIYESGAVDHEKEKQGEFAQKKQTSVTSLLPFAVKKRSPKNEIKAEPGLESCTRGAVSVKVQRRKSIRIKFHVVKRLCQRLKRSIVERQEDCKISEQSVGAKTPENATIETQKETSHIDCKMPESQLFQPTATLRRLPESKDYDTETVEECVVFVEGANSDHQGFSMHKASGYHHCFDQTTIASTHHCVEVTTVARPSNAIPSLIDSDIPQEETISVRMPCSTPKSQLGGTSNDQASSRRENDISQPRLYATTSNVDGGQPKSLATPGCYCEPKQDLIKPADSFNGNIIDNDELSALTIDPLFVPEDQHCCSKASKPIPKQKGWRSKLRQRTTRLFGRKTRVDQKNIIVQGQWQEEKQEKCDNLSESHRTNDASEEERLLGHAVTEGSSDGLCSEFGDSKSSMSFSFATSMKKLSMLQIISAIQEELQKLDEETHPTHFVPLEES